jgi:hypothetical protein
MAVSKVVMIVPRLPPAIDGVGDYAMNLAKRLRQDFSMDTNFISLAKDSEGVHGFSVDGLCRRSSTFLNPILDNINSANTIVLLHYATRSYGYKGCPFWLLNSLQRYKKRGGRLAIMFHEIYAQDASILSSDFWLASIQKYLVKDFCDLADQVFTNCEDYAILLQNLKRDFYPKLVVLPVPSNVGEPESLKPLRDRERRLVVFGQGGNKMRAYESSAAIHAACKMLDIKEIWDIGPSAGVPESVAGLPVMRIGEKSTEDIGVILMNSIAGCLSYRHDRLGKSGIFASYCAYGVLPINVNCQSDRSLGSDYKSETASGFRLVPGEHYVRADNPKDLLQPSLSRLQAIANSASSWYKTHTLSVQSKTFFKHLESPFLLPDDDVLVQDVLEEAT